MQQAATAGVEAELSSIEWLALPIPFYRERSWKGELYRQGTRNVRHRPLRYMSIVTV
jgi:hypothetical protein